MLDAIRLLLTGDFTGDMRHALGEEDSPLVGLILAIREAVTK